ncbi:peroxiredoxin [Dyadobacter sp. 3J3]|uniref:peroxiredoxin n=1 Tax=Dyadobacter sp. 3J3 TaxID=2606600 RepID=UPI00135B86B7|nr:peroxiredoxin [Dyadobacter sp. 3J3]
MKNETIEIGDKVPAFILKDQDGNTFSSADYVGKKKMVIYFYPKNESGVCTKEACAFRDSYADYQDAGAMVIGINSGSVESHKAFQQHHRLPFNLLSDPGNIVLKSFGIKNVLFLTGRETFVVDLNGAIAFKFRGFLNGHAHSQKVLEFFDLSDVK